MKSTYSRIFRWLAALFVTGTLLTPATSRAAFGLTTNSSYYQVDTGAGLVFKIRRIDSSSTTSPGDIMSLVYNGVEYQDQSRGSQINSGFDWIYNYTNAVSITPTVYGTNYIKITVVCGDTNSTNGVLTHYYIVRNGYPHIYMATHFTREPEVQALVRYILRIPSSKLPNGPVPSDIRNATNVIESGDIFSQPDGTTRSKHYSNMRVMDWSYIGARGPGVGMWMVRDSNEGASGGPFYRCLLNQCDSDQEITYIVNYGEGQTEAYRIATLNGLYTLVFTGGSAPGPVDTSWLQTSGLNLLGFVPETGRGIVTGAVSGVTNGFQAVVGFASTNAQYWTTADTNGNYTTPLMIPGTYAAKLYRQELAVGSGSVTVTAATTNTLNLASTWPDPATIFRIGQWDGTPSGFLNADKMTYMHPSDPRMSAWGTGSNSFNVGTDSVSTFPAVCFRGANTHTYIHFTLTSGQIANLTLKIGATTAYNNGRPDVKINGVDRAYPSASTQPNSRTITVGTYRGNNVTWSWTLPSSSLIAGQNVLDISPVSGNPDLGTWLSASWVYDCVELSGSGGPGAPLSPPSGLVATPGNNQVTLQWTAVSNATSYAVSRSTVSAGPYKFIAVTGAATNFLDPSVTNGNTYYYVVTALNANGETGYSAEASAVPLLASPLISQVQNAEGNLSISGGGGPANWTYYVLAATNLSAAVWTPVATNQFDGSGNFSLTITNGVDAAQPGMFYKLQLQ